MQEARNLSDLPTAGFRVAFVYSVDPDYNGESGFGLKLACYILAYNSCDKL